MDQMRARICALEREKAVSDREKAVLDERLVSLEREKAVSDREKAVLDERLLYLETKMYDPMFMYFRVLDRLRNNHAEWLSSEANWKDLVSCLDGHLHDAFAVMGFKKEAESFKLKLLDQESQGRSEEKDKAEFARLFHKFNNLPLWAQGCQQTLTPLCDYNVDEMGIKTGKYCTLLEKNNDPTQWRVQTMEGREGIVPSVIFRVPSSKDFAHTIMESLRNQLSEKDSIVVPSLALNSGHSMPSVGLGTWLCKAPMIGEIVTNAFDNGYRHFDCAYIHQNQQNIGKALKELLIYNEREVLFITSKVWNTFHSHGAALENIDTILDQLGLKYLDLCLIHWPIGYKEGDGHFPMDEMGHKVCLSNVDFLDTWRALEEAVHRGKVRAIGVSNFNSDQIKRILDSCTIRPSVLQAECHPFFQQRKLRDFCKNKGIQFVASCPLGSSADNMFRKTDYPTIFNNPTISDIAKKLHKSNAQVALRFLTQLGIAVVPRTTDEKRQRENLDIFGFWLSEEQMALMGTLDTGKRIVYLPVSAHSADFPFGANCPDDRGQTEF